MVYGKARVPGSPGRSRSSSRPAPTTRPLAQELLAKLLPHAGGARRVGITGVPGVGKSTFIDALGTTLTARRATRSPCSPSTRRSTRTGGSILGDKTRMARLSVDPPPSSALAAAGPSAASPGATRETMVVCEAAGFDVVLVETVGVGQSETTVADMVDTFLLLTLASDRRQLQGIKKGVLELADVIAVNKADGEHEPAAPRRRGELAGALRMLRSTACRRRC